MVVSWLKLRRCRQCHRSPRQAGAPLAAAYAEEDAPKGEIAVVIGAGVAQEATAEDVDTMLRTALATLSVRDAAAHVAAATGLPKKQIYERALQVQDDAE